MPDPALFRADAIDQETAAFNKQLEEMFATQPPTHTVPTLGGGVSPRPRPARANSASTVSAYDSRPAPPPNSSAVYVLKSQ